MVTNVFTLENNKFQYQRPVTAIALPANYKSAIMFACGGLKQEVQTIVCLSKQECLEITIVFSSLSTPKDGLDTPTLSFTLEKYFMFSNSN